MLGVFSAKNVAADGVQEAPRERADHEGADRDVEHERVAMYREEKEGAREDWPREHHRDETSEE